jgi:hypothetical protein
MPTLIDFLNSGQLGDLHCELPKEDVRDLLGEPQAVSSRGNPEIWKYGSLELTFYRTSTAERAWLSSIAIHFDSDSLSLPASVGLTGWLPTSETTLNEFRRYLDCSGVQVSGGVVSGPDKHLVLSSGVHITFDEDRLFSVGYTLRREPEFKQITVAIPLRELSAIQQEAAAAGVSVSKLCARWIMERATNLQPN